MDGYVSTAHLLGQAKNCILYTKHPAMKSDHNEGAVLYTIENGDLLSHRYQSPGRKFTKQTPTRCLLFFNWETKTIRRGIWYGYIGCPKWTDPSIWPFLTRWLFSRRNFVCKARQTRMKIEEKRMMVGSAYMACIDCRRKIYRFVWLLFRGGSFDMETGWKTKSFLGKTVPDIQTMIPQGHD